MTSRLSAAANRVLDEVSPDQALALAQELVRIPSENPPGNEQAVAAHLGQHLAELGLKVQLKEVQPGRPNVVGVWESGRSGPTLLFNGHLDVVPAGSDWTVDPYGGVISDGRLYGRGACDMKGPLAAFVAALAGIQRAKAPIRGNVIIAGVMGEEEDQSGTRQLVADGIQADFAICGEPTKLVPVIAHKGDFYYDITTIGKAAHGSVPHMGVNAIAKMVPVIEGVLKLSEQLEHKKHPLCGHPTVSMGVIRGGNVTCAVPDRCTLSLDRRLIPGETAAEATAEIQALLDSISRADPEFRVEMQNPVRALPMEIGSDEPIVVSLRRQTELLMGVDPGVQGWNATCDANMLVNDLGIPTCIYGPGDISGQAHKPDESIEIDELVQGAKIYALVMLETLGS